MTVYLKPCPFCGGKALLDLAQPQADSYRGVTVACVKCGATVSARNARKAAGKWNRRAGCRPGRIERC